MTSPALTKLFLVCAVLAAASLAGCRPSTVVAEAGVPPGPAGTKKSGTRSIRRTPIAVPPPRVGASSPSIASDEMLLGNADNATENTQNRDHYLLRRSGFTASYNDTLRFPNWVSWRLAKADIGDVERGQFKPDTALPNDFTRVTPSDYTNTGFDRGHNCPSKDRTRNREDNDGVFVMTNITPQTHAMNAGPWENLESYCRTLAQQGNELYIVCGHGFNGSRHRTTGPQNIAVPDWGWKVVVVIPEASGDDRQRITTQTRVIAVKMPNINGIDSDPWNKYTTTPADLERATGLRLFSGLTPAVAAALRQTRDAGTTDSASPTSTTSGSRRARPVDSTGTVPGPGAGSSTLVWVNTRSGAYWKPGTRFYGKTKEGKFLRESEALNQGFHPAEP